MEEGKLNEVVCLIKFIIILDNDGKLIYSKYYNGFEKKEQKEFEKKICFTCQNINVSKDEVDIFSLNQFSVISKINKEIAIFIGINEEENECLAYNFFTTFENVLISLVSEKLSKQQILMNFENLAALIDEMVNEGIIMETDGNNLEQRINPSGRNTTNANNFISFGNAPSSSSNSGGSLFGSLFSTARTIFG